MEYFNCSKFCVIGKFNQTDLCVHSKEENISILTEVDRTPACLIFVTRNRAI